MDKRESYNQYIADNIRRLRKQKGWSQEVLAAKLQTLGMNYTHARISQVELHKRPPAAVLVVALKHLFQCEYSEFFQQIEQDFNRVDE